MFPSQIRRIGGPIPKFTDYHIWKTLMVLSVERPMGRKALSKYLNVGEGSTRTIVSLFSELDLISVNKKGIILTDAGNEAKAAMQLECHIISLGDLTIGEKDCAVRIPGSLKKITYGCEERDTAILAGATGATTLVCMDDKLMFPGSEYPVSKDIENAVRKIFKIKNDDVIIIGTSDSYEKAEVGAVTAAIGVLGGISIKKELQDILNPGSAPSEILSLAFAIHDLVGGLPVCAKSRDNLGIRIENGAVIDNAYTGDILEEAILVGTTIRRVAVTGPYKGIKVIVTPIELDRHIIAAIGVVDIRSMAGVDNLIRKRFEDE